MMTVKKLSKSDSGPVWHKAQVFRFRRAWLASCQEGCLIRHVPGATQELMFRIAEGHMRKAHGEGRYRSLRIHARRAA